MWLLQITDKTHQSKLCIMDLDKLNLICWFDFRFILVFAAATAAPKNTTHWRKQPLKVKIRRPLMEPHVLKISSRWHSCSQCQRLCRCGSCLPWRPLKLLTTKWDEFLGLLWSRICKKLVYLTSKIISQKIWQIIFHIFSGVSISRKSWMGKQLGRASECLNVFCLIGNWNSCSSSPPRVNPIKKFILKKWLNQLQYYLTVHFFNLDCNNSA